MKTRLGALAVLLAFMCTATGSQTPAEYRRSAEQTYLTFPEWYLVFSPAEYATYVRTEDPSGFPFLGHVRQLWQSYAAVARETSSEKYVFNGGYHVMIMVIGVSTTVEYAIRSAYETILGRLAELTTSEQTAEDTYGARVAQEYVDFIRVRPWYEFDFWGRLTTLWSDVPSSGAGLTRKWERRYALTTEYLVKAGYGWLIGIGTHASYDRPLPTTAVVLDREVDGTSLKLLPRYEAFTAATMDLANAGINFHEVAGNGQDADILISVLVDGAWQAPFGSREVFSQPIMTHAGRVRHALAVPVGSLAEMLRDLSKRPIVVEHVFDF